jgi:hypothetical protein
MILVPSYLARIQINRVRSRDNSVGVATGYGLDGPGSIPSRVKIYFSPQHPDRLWDPPSLLSNGYGGLLSRRYSGQDMNLTTHFHVVPRSRMVEIYLHSLIRLHGVVRPNILLSTLFSKTPVYPWHKTKFHR